MTELRMFIKIFFLLVHVLDTIVRIMLCAGIPAQIKIPPQHVIVNLEG